MTHLETYLDVLKLLPNELQRELVLMGELDKKATAVRQEMEAMQEIIIEAASGGATKANADKKNAMGGGANGEPTEAQLLHLRQLQQMLVDLHNEKLALAKQSKDMVVAYASRLDDDIQLFAADLPPEVVRAGQDPFEEPQPLKKKHSSNNSSRSHSAKDHRGGSHKKSHKKHAESSDESESSASDDDEADEEEEEEEEEEGEEYEERGGAGGGGANKAQKSGGGGGGAASPTASSSDEKLYCVCQQPSYGDMVGCDNETCPYEWFHFACIGLKKQPKGDWVCDECKSKADA